MNAHELNPCLPETYHVDLKMAINIKQIEAPFGIHGAKNLILIKYCVECLITYKLRKSDIIVDIFVEHTT